jgi:hypothetical protein
MNGGVCENSRRGQIQPSFCTMTSVSNRVDAAFGSIVIIAFSILCIWLFGNDVVSNCLVLAAFGAGALGLWNRMRHFAVWLSGGVAAVSGAILTLILEASMNGATEDPSTFPVLLAFIVGAVVSAVLYSRVAHLQDRRDRDLDRLLSALPTVALLEELEQRLVAALEQAKPTQATSWRTWWRARPR